MDIPFLLDAVVQIFAVSVWAPSKEGASRQGHEEERQPSILCGSLRTARARGVPGRGRRILHSEHLLEGSSPEVARAMNASSAWFVTTGIRGASRKPTL